MKSMNNNNNWLGFSLSPQINMEVPKELDHHNFLSPTTHLSTHGYCYEVENGSLCIMEALNRAQTQGMMQPPTPKLEDFLGCCGPNIGTHHQYNHQQNQEMEANRNHHPLELLQQPFHGMYEEPMANENWFSRQYNDLGYGDLHSLSLSMSSGSQSSCVKAPHYVSNGGAAAADCLALDVTRKKVGKKTVHRKSIDTFGQRTSQYRGVTRHRWTGRYEAHLWDNSCKKEGQTRKGRQVYLGGYDMEDKAARAYDLAALKYWGPSTHINFPLENYHGELEEMKSMGRQEYVAHLRRKSSGFSRGASIYRGVTRHHQHGRWQARIGRVAGNKDLYLGTFSTQEEAAEAYDVAAIKFRCESAVTNFDITRYDVQKIIASPTLLSGENAQRTKAIEAQNTNKETDLDGDWKMVLYGSSPSQALDHNQTVNHAGTRISTSSSLVTSLNSSREGSPNEPRFKSVGTSPIGSWIPSISMAQIPLFAAFGDV